MSNINEEGEGNISFEDNGHLQGTFNDIITKWGDDCFKEPVKVDVEKSITTAGEVFLLFGFPCATKPTGEMYDVQRRLPLYTKNNKDLFPFINEIRKN